MNRTLTAVAAAVLVATLTACDGTDRRPAGPIDIAIGVGFTAGAPAPTLTDAARAVFEEAVWSNGYYQLFSGDGAPRLVDHNILGSESDVDSVVLDEQRKMLEGIDELLLAAVPRTPQAAPLDVLAAAARGFEHADRERWILMIGNGISTTAPLDLSLGENLYRDPVEFVSAIAANGGLADLTGITVYWSGIGDTVPGQPMTEDGRQRLITLWTELVRVMGGELVVLESKLPSIDPAGFVDPLPIVNTVFVRQTITPDGPVVLGEESITFHPDSGAYLERERAIAVLAPYAQQIKDQSLRVTLTGVTARERSEAEQIDTGMLRALAVQATLVNEFGVPPELISVNSVGSFWACWNEEYPGGVYSPEAAQSNRSIVITLPGQTIEDACR